MKTPIVARTALLTLALSMAAPQASAVTLLEVYQQALENNHEFRAARANYQAGQEYRNLGRSALLPQIGAEANYSRTDGSDDADNQQLSPDTDPREPDTNLGDYESTGKSYGVNLTQPLVDFGAWYSFKQGKALANEAEAVFLDEMQELVLRTTNAYFAVLKAMDDLDTARAEAEALSQQLEQSRQRFEVGLTAVTEVHEAQAAYDSANANRLQAEGNLGIAFEALEVLTGQSYGQLAPLEEELEVAPPEPANREHWEELALENNALLQAAEFRAAAAKANANISRAEHFPELYGSVSYGHQEVDYSTGGLELTTRDDTATTFGLTLSVPLFSGGGISASRRQAYSQFLSTRELYLNARRNTVQAARVSYLDVITAAATVKARKQAIISGQSALEATQAGYEVGTRDLVDVLNAQRNLYSVQRDFYDALYTYIISGMELKKAAGVLDEEAIVQLNQALDTSRTVEYTR